MKQQDRKKDREILMLKRFIKAAKLTATILEDKRESPDFIVSIDGRRVGIEVADVFIYDEGNPSPNGMLPQAATRIKNDIVWRAWRLHHQAGLFPAHVRVSFVENLELNELNRVETARKLASIIGGLKLREWQEARWLNEMRGDLPAAIQSFSVRRVPSIEMSAWFAGDGGWMAPLTTEMLQRSVDEKALKLPRYRQVVNENWLLLIADSFQPAQFLEVGNDFEPSGVISPFDRTFFHRSPDRSCIELLASRSVHR